MPDIQYKHGYMGPNKWVLAFVSALPQELNDIEHFINILQMRRRYHSNKEDKEMNKINLIIVGIGFTKQD